MENDAIESPSTGSHGGFGTHFTINIVTRWE